MADNDKEEMLEEKEFVENSDEPVEEKAEETDAVTKNYPANKYELAIVAAQEARRLNETWKDPEERQTCRVTEKALERVEKGEVHFTVQDNEDS